MSQQVNYEVHTLQNGQWSIHAHFDSYGKDRAIAEARQLEKANYVMDIKVVRETYDENAGSHNNLTVYRMSPEVKKSKPKTAPSFTPSSTSFFESYDADFNGDPFGDQGGVTGNKKAKSTTLTAITIKILIVALVSISVAAMVSMVASVTLSGQTLFGMTITGNNEANLLFLVFVGTFLITSLSLANSFLRGHVLSGSKKPKQQRKQGKPLASKSAQKEALNSSKQGKKNAPKPTSKSKDPKTKESKTEGSKFKRTESEEEMLEEVEEAIEKSDKLKAEKQKEKEQAARDSKKEKEEKKKKREEDKQRREEEAEAEAEKASEESFKPKSRGTLSPHAEQQKEYMMSFLNETLRGIGVEQDRMDNFNKFGVNLFLAGACETLCDTQNVDATERETVLADCVRVMGFKKSHAKSFSEKYEEYLMADSRYMQMFQAGRNTLNTHLEDATAATKNMSDAISEWNKPKHKVEHTGPISVLFTDIAGSTALTQSLGDIAAQEIVRAHNRVVRQALTHHYGKEIKHTGDGIMASFDQIPDSVNAAMEMQQQAKIIFESSPNTPLELKIGINAGEPIAEDNDLFGATVQMAARIVDKAAANEIFISEVVKGLCTNLPLDLINRGGYSMKGFDDDQTLHEVQWKK